MYNQLQHTTNIQFSTTILEQDLQRTFFKCRKWQLEQTLDPINCPYHYYCNSHYAGDYSSWVDTLVIFITAFSFFAATFTIIAAIVGGSRPPEPPWLTKFNRFRRYFLPSGPILLPIIVVLIAKGSRVNTLFGLARTGPAILQLVRVSALSFETKTESDVKYVSLEVSTMSGILQAALYLDSIILPYYTGLDALESSRFSGECLSCICREEALVVGGTVIYRGWSVTTAMVVGALILRMFTRLAPEIKAKTMAMKMAIESISWILMIVESLYLVVVLPPERSRSTAISFSAIFVLICLQIVRRLIALVFGFCNGSQENKGRLYHYYKTAQLQHVENVA